MCTEFRVLGSHCKWKAHGQFERRIDRGYQTWERTTNQFGGSINSQTVHDKLTLLETQLGDLSASMGLIAEDLRQMFAEQFASAGAAGGTPWAALAPSTLKRKRGGSGMLQKTGALLSSLIDPESPDHVARIDQHSLTVGSDLPYAMFHQTGAGWGFGQTSLPPAPRHGHGVPMRPLLVLTSDREDKWVGFVAQRIQSPSPLLGATQLRSGL